MFNCYQCGQACRTKRSLSRHKRSKHPGADDSRTWDTPTGINWDNLIVLHSPQPKVHSPPAVPSYLQCLRLEAISPPVLADPVLEPCVPLSPSDPTLVTPAEGPAQVELINIMELAAYLSDLAPECPPSEVETILAVEDLKRAERKVIKMDINLNELTEEDLDLWNTPLPSLD